MADINKFKDFIIDHYTNNYVEDERFTYNSKKLEFLTTMKYIKSYLKKDIKILEIGAGTGAYTLELAKMGYTVTAIELVPYHFSLLQEKCKNYKNVTCINGDVLDLSIIKDSSFDLVLNLGPMYHLYTTDDKMKAIEETLRVCKNDGICFFAYLTHSSIFWNFGVRKNKLSYLKPNILPKGRLIDVPEEIFSSYLIEEFNSQFDNLNVTYLKSVATDGVSQLMRDYIDNVMTEEDYQILVDWHFETCERLDHQGLSSHMLYICKKN